MGTLPFDSDIALRIQEGLLTVIGPFVPYHFLDFSLSSFSARETPISPDIRAVAEHSQGQ